MSSRFGSRGKNVCCSWVLPVSGVGLQFDSTAKPIRHTPVFQARDRLILSQTCKGTNSRSKSCQTSPWNLCAAITFARESEFGLMIPEKLLAHYTLTTQPSDCWFMRLAEIFRHGSRWENLWP